MTDTQPIDETAFEPYIGQPAPEPAFICHVCGENRGTKVLYDLEDSQADLFCAACLIVTFAQLADQIGQMNS